MNSRPRLYTFLKIWTPDWDQQNIKYNFLFAATWPKQHYHKTTLYDLGCQRGGFVARRMILIKNIWHNLIHRFWVCMVVANCHGAWTVYCVWPMPSHFILSLPRGQPVTGWTLTRLTGAGQSSFCSLAVTVSHLARKRWLKGVLDFAHGI